MDFQAWYFLDLEALESLIIARQLTDETLQEPDYVEFYYTCTLTTGITKDTVPFHQRTVQLTGNVFILVASEPPGVGQSDARPLNESTRNNPISFNLLLTTCLSTKLIGETILL